MQQGQLHGVVALVAGAGPLGEAVCLALTEAGATAVPADVRLEEARAVARHACRAGVEALPLDATDSAQSAGAIEHMVMRYGRLDALVCTAGAGAVELARQSLVGPRGTSRGHLLYVVAGNEGPAASEALALEAHARGVRFTAVVGAPRLDTTAVARTLRLVLLQPPEAMLPEAVVLPPRRA